MADKKLKTRIQLKHDTAANWSQATNFIPLIGEIIIYDADTTNSAPRVKIGDGKTVVAALPFISNADEIATAIAALDASDPSASGTSTTFISTISQTDGVISATKASIPTASGTTLGMVKGGGDVTISSGVITVTDNSHKHTSANISDLGTTIETAINNAVEALDVSEPAASGTSTTFIATAKQTNGVIEVTKASIPTANGTTMGMVKQGGDVTIASGVITVNDDSHNHVISNVDGLQTALDAKATPADITSAISALDASDPAASGTATQFITSISQKDGVITATKANITAAALGLSGAMKFLGTSATAISDGATTNPITIGTTSTTVTAGNVVLYGAKEFVWTGSKWEELGNEGSYKVQQSAVSSPSASGNATAFIDSISQNAQGVITATKKNVTFPTLSGGSAAGNDATVVGGVTVSGHAVTVGKKTLTAGSNVTITGGTDTITIAAKDTTYTLGSFGITATAAELNKMDGVTATTAELNYVDGVTSNIQTQLNGKVPTSRTVNGKALSGNISLTYSDVEAAPAGFGLGTDGVSGIDMNNPPGSGLFAGTGASAADYNWPTGNSLGYGVMLNIDRYSNSHQLAWYNNTLGIRSQGSNGEWYDWNIVNLSNLLNTTNYSNYAVPLTRTVNGKALSSNISLSFSDVGAAPATEVQASYTLATSAELDSTLSSVLSNLANGTAKTIHINYRSSTPIGQGDWFMTIRRAAADYGTVEAIHDYSTGILKKYRSYYGGAWTDWVDIPNHTHDNYLPLSGGTLTGEVTAPRFNGILGSFNTRDQDFHPNEYAYAGLKLEFKESTTVGISEGTYTYVATYQPWGDVTNWSGGKATQMAFGNSGNIYIRKGDGSGWDNWRTLLSSDNYSSYCVPTSRTVNGKALSGNISLTYSDVGADASGKLTPVAITANVDLDNYTSYGWYYCPADATVATLSNCPTVRAFFLEVGRHAGIYQRLVEYTTSAPKVYFRNYYNGAWGAWQREYTTVDKPTANDVGALPLSGGTLTGSLWAQSTGEVDIGINYTSGKSLYLYGNYSTGTRGLYDSTVGTVISVTNSGATFYGNATTATAATTASKLGATTLTTTDATDAFLEAGVMKFATVNDAATSIANDGVLLSLGWSSTFGTQIWLDDGSSAASMQIRNRTSSSWNSWAKVLTENNYSSFAVPLTRTINGKALSSNISLTYSDVGAAAASHYHDSLQGWSDTRNVTTTPNDYNSMFRIMGIKTSTGTGTLDGSTYSTVVGIRGWSDSSGGNSHELAFTGEGQIYRRHGATTSWNSWVKILDSDNYSSYALPLSGGTLTGNLTVSGTTSNTWLRATNNTGTIYLESAASGNRGLYDNSAGWIIYADTSNAVKVGAARPVASNVLRNISGGTAALTSGSSALTTGDIYIQYI